MFEQLRALGMAQTSALLRTTGSFFSCFIEGKRKYS
jgi:hypothetical protein